MLSTLSFTKHNAPNHGLNTSGFVYFFSGRPVSVTVRSNVPTRSLHNAMRELATSIFTLKMHNSQTVSLLYPEDDNLDILFPCLLSLGVSLRPISHSTLKFIGQPDGFGYDRRKLSGWLLEDFEKLLFLDTDTLILKDLHTLFDYGELAAVSYGYPTGSQRINLGMFVLEPNSHLFSKLLGQRGSNDQDVLMDFYKRKNSLVLLPYWYLYDQQTFSRLGEFPREKILGFHFKGMKPTMFGPWNGSHCVDLRDGKGVSGWRDKAQCDFTSGWVDKWHSFERKLILEHPECNFKDTHHQ